MFIHISPETFQECFIHTKKTGAGLFKILNRECLCSYFARQLFCRSTNIFHKLCLHPHVSSLCTGVIVLSPQRPRQEKAFHLTALVDRLYPCLVQKKTKKTEIIFSVLAPSQPVRKTFFYWFGRPGVFLSAWMCRYYCTCVEEQNGFICLRANASSVHVVLRVNGSLKDKCSTSSKYDLMCLSFTLFTFLTRSQ